MTLCTVRSRRRRLVLAVTGCVLGAFALTHVSLETLARWIEVRRSGYLWSDEVWLQILTPSYYRGRGEGRIFLTGSSEVREAFLPDRVSARLPGLTAFQSAYPLATLQDLPVLLEYLERAYGAAALSRRLVVGVSSRFVANLRFVGQMDILPVSPLFEAALAVASTI